MIGTRMSLSEYRENVKYKVYQSMNFQFQVS